MICLQEHNYVVKMYLEYALRICIVLCIAVGHFYTVTDRIPRSRVDSGKLTKSASTLDRVKSMDHVI